MQWKRCAEKTINLESSHKELVAQFTESGFTRRFDSALQVRSFLDEMLSSKDTGIQRACLDARSGRSIPPSPPIGPDPVEHHRHRDGAADQAPEPVGQEQRRCDLADVGRHGAAGGFGGRGEEVVDAGEDRER